MGSNAEHVPTAIVKGGGPSGLAAAIVLAQEGFQVTLVEKRPKRPENQGRQNMVAIRPEALHQLDLLGVLPALDNASALTPLTRAATVNEKDGSVFTWPLDTQVRYPLPSSSNGTASSYTPPDQLDSQVPSSYVTLGLLEDHLASAAANLGVMILYETSIKLELQPDSETYTASLVPVSGHSVRSGSDQRPPDLIVCASGKGDTALEAELGFQKTIGNVLDEETLPLSGSRDLRLGPSNAVESQKFCVFGVRTPAAEMGILKQVTRSYGEPEQPVVEIEMRHAEASHCLLQLPRGFPYHNPAKVEAYILERVNERLATSFSSAEDMKSKGVILWGEPTVPVTVETAIAPKFAFGSNVVLVGDAGMSCSPSSGLGAEVGLTHDVQGIRELAKCIVRKGELGSKSEKMSALDAFNVHKAKGSIMWSKGSNFFYITKEEADAIVRGKQSSS